LLPLAAAAGGAAGDDPAARRIASNLARALSIALAISVLLLLLLLLLGCEGQQRTDQLTVFLQYNVISTYRNAGKAPPLKQPQIIRA
jgi:hypothetical protein